MRRPTPRKPRADLARCLIQGASGGLLAGALIGLAEAGWLLVTAGAPDLVAPLYAVILYGLIGVPFGIGAGFVLFGVEKVRSGQTEATAWAFGFAGATAPLLLFILYYLANKVVYLEQGVPLQGKLTVVAIAVGVSLIGLLVWPFLLHGAGGVLLKFKGMAVAWGGLALVTLALSELPLVPDPREGWAHGASASIALADKPDVLVIMVDTLRADHLGAYGGPPTPALDALAADGIVFERAYAQASWTRSSGASLFTSRLPSSHNADTKAARLPDEVVTFAETLESAGLTTGALINNINMTSTFNFDQGFDTFYYEAPAYRFGATESVFGLTLYKVVHKVAERVVPGGKRVDRYYQPADVVLADATQWIEANDGARWALFVHLMEPHDPYFEHPSIAGTGTADYNGVGFARAEVEHPDPADVDYLRGVYRDEVVFMDGQIAPFLDWLHETGRYDDTLIVLTSDHGEEFNEHGGFWHGTTLYEEQIHVPLLVKPPGDALAGVRVPWQVRSIDIAPTLAVAVGARPDPSWQGYDLLAEVMDELEPPAEEPPADEPPADAPPEEPVADDAVPDQPARSHPRDRVVISEEDFEGNVLAAIRWDGFKYHRANEGNPRGLPTEQLFDTVADSAEAANLIGSGTAVAGMYPDDIAAALADDLRLEITNASEGAAESGTVSMSAAECERLKALGYLAADEDCG